MVILAGGIGTRFWPASTPARPKQLLPLASSRPLFEETLLRARSLTSVERIHLLAAAPMVEAFRTTADTLPEAACWVEPRARGTAPVLAWAAHRIHREEPEAVMVSLHADHRIEPLEAFTRGILEAVAVARATDLLLTIGVIPDRPETGYGWIRPGDPVTGSPHPCRRVAAFVEKPDLPRAQRYLAEGLLWNSGIFVWRVDRFLAEIRAHAPEIAPHLPLLDAGREEAFFEAVTPISVDEAVLERSGRVGVLPAPFAWDDVGSWGALPRTRPADAEGNVVEGRAMTVDARRNVIWAEDGPVVLFGVEDLVVVRAGGITVVAPRDRSPDWKDLLRHLPEDLARSDQATPAPPPFVPEPGETP